MTADEFEAWLTTMGYSGRAGAEALGVTKDTAASYRKKGAPRYIALACAALASGLSPWEKEKL